MADPGLRFRTAVVSSLRFKDFRGDYADVAVGADGITFTGERQGLLHVPFARIARLRVGFVEAKTGKVFRSLLWLDGDEEAPIYLLPMDDDAAYANAMRAIAARLASDGRLSRVEGGTTKLDALIGSMLFVPITIAAIWIALIVSKAWWQPIAIASAPALATAAVVWSAYANHWPRAVTALGDLDRQLPPVWDLRCGR